jgi:RNA polymerase sigma factor (sigma-70 family)
MEGKLMADRRAAGVLRQVGDAARASAPDAALLAWFAADRDEAAFAELVRRHGPVVLGVCHRVAGHRQDAEDAFQAVFLTLAAKAGRLTRPERLGNWLYGVAVHVARRARRAAARRLRRENQVVAMPDRAANPPGPSADLSAEIDNALAVLPERFRDAIVLCDLYELTRSEAAVRLGVPEGTLSSRLNTARKRLAERLARGGVVGTIALGGAVRAAVPAELARRAVRTAVAGASAGPVTAGVRSLAAGGELNMRRLIGWAVASAAAIGLAVGAVAALPGPKAELPNPPASKPADSKADPPAVPAAKPGSDPEKPVRSGKPRLVQTFELSAHATRMPVWSPDGTLLAVEQSGGPVAVYDTRTLDVRATAVTRRPAGILGFVAGKPTLVTFRSAVGRINAESHLQFWDMPEPVPAGVPAVARRPAIRADREVEFDPSDGIPFAVRPDGKAVLTLAVTRRSRAGTLIGGSAVVRLLDAATGEAVRELARVEGDLYTVSLSPDGKSLAVVYDRLGEPEDPKQQHAAPSRTAVVESIDVPDGKRRWSREFKGWGKLSSGSDTLRAVYSPDRKWLAVTLEETAKERAAIYGTIRLLDAGTGKDGARLEDQGNLVNNPMSFSHEGRLLVGRTDGDDGSTSLRVWDVPTGRVRKSWEGRALAAFAPDRPVLAVLEDITAEGSNDPPRAVLGFWDLSALTK